MINLIFFIQFGWQKITQKNIQKISSIKTD